MSQQKKDIVERLEQAVEASGGRDIDAQDARDEIISLRLTKMEQEEFVAAEVRENIRIFELLGLTDESKFGERSSTQAIADEIAELLRRNSNQAKTIHYHQMACKAAGTDPTEGCVKCIDTLRSSLTQSQNEVERLRKALEEVHEMVSDTDTYPYSQAKCAAARSRIELALSSPSPASEKGGEAT